MSCTRKFQSLDFGTFANQTLVPRLDASYARQVRSTFLALKFRKFFERILENSETFTLFLGSLGFSGVREHSLNTYTGQFHRMVLKSSEKVQEYSKGSFEFQSSKFEDSGQVF